jgi:hypothetical protein
MMDLPHRLWSEGGGKIKGQGAKMGARITKVELPNHSEIKEAYRILK